MPKSYSFYCESPTEEHISKFHELLFICECFASTTVWLVFLRCLLNSMNVFFTVYFHEWSSQMVFGGTVYFLFKDLHFTNLSVKFVEFKYLKKTTYTVVYSVP